MYCNASVAMALFYSNKNEKKRSNKSILNPLATHYKLAHGRKLSYIPIE